MTSRYSVRSVVNLHHSADRREKNNEEDKKFLDSGAAVDNRLDDSVSEGLFLVVLHRHPSGFPSNFTEILWTRICLLVLMLTLGTNVYYNTIVAISMA